MICIEIIRHRMDEWDKISKLNDSYIIIYNVQVYALL